MLYSIVMMIQIYGTKKCKESKKADRFFKDRSIKIQFVNIMENEITPGIWKKIFQQIDPKDLIDEKSSYYLKQGYAYRDFDAAEELLDHIELLKLPILRKDNQFYNGFDQDLWKKLIKEQ